MAKESQKKITDFIAKAIESKEDVEKFGRDFGVAIAAYPNLESVVRVLVAHAPVLQDGIYIQPTNKWGKKLKPRLLTTATDWEDDIKDEELVTKEEVIPRRVRESKWFRCILPNGINEIRLPVATKRYEIIVKKKKKIKEAKEVSAKEGSKEVAEAA